MNFHWPWQKPEIVERYTVVEIEKPSPLAESPEALSEVRSLQHHAGFQYLLRKLKIQSAKLQSQLNSSQNLNNEDVYYKSGIFWTAWLQSQLDFAHSRYLSMRSASPSEEQFLNEIASNIELVGSDPGHKP